MESKATPRPWRTGSLVSFNAMTGEREMFIYRLPPGDPDETADNRIRVRGSAKMNCVADAELIVTAVNAHDTLEAAVATLTAANERLVKERDALREACESAALTYAALERNLEPIVAALHREALPTSWLELELNKAAKIRAALKLVEE